MRRERESIDSLLYRGPMRRRSSRLTSGHVIRGFGHLRMLQRWRQWLQARVSRCRSLRPDQPRARSCSALTARSSSRRVLSLGTSSSLCSRSCFSSCSAKRSSARSSVLGHAQFRVGAPVGESHSQDVAAHAIVLEDHRVISAHRQRGNYRRCSLPQRRSVANGHQCDPKRCLRSA